MVSSRPAMPRRPGGSQQMPLTRAVIGQCRPAAPADLITLVITLPAELHAATSAALRAAVHPPPDDDETELAGPAVTELDEAGLHQVDGLLVPHVHLHDPPPAVQVHCSLLLLAQQVIGHERNRSVRARQGRRLSAPTGTGAGCAARLRPGPARAACARASRRRHPLPWPSAVPHPPCPRHRTRIRVADVAALRRSLSCGSRCRPAACVMRSCGSSGACPA